jgi:hypothetical protein
LFAVVTVIAIVVEIVHGSIRRPGGSFADRLVEEFERSLDDMTVHEFAAGTVHNTYHDRPVESANLNSSHTVSEATKSAQSLTRQVRRRAEMKLR